MISKRCLNLTLYGLATREIQTSRPAPTQQRILSILADGKPRSHREIVDKSRLSEAETWQALRRAWEAGRLLRTRNPNRESQQIFKGRGGLSRNQRSYHLYILRPQKRSSLQVKDYEFVSFDPDYLDPRGGGTKSKARRILEYLRNYSHKAFFSKQIAQALADDGVRIADVMANVRRFEKQGLVYVRGYRTDQRQTPFLDGYLTTWVDPTKRRDQALSEAIERTSAALQNIAATNPIIERVHRVRDMIFEASKLRELVGFNYIHEKLGCTEYQAEDAVRRSTQLYNDLREVKLFGAYKYYSHSSLQGNELNAAIKMKENYVRKTQGRMNRVGHNWEACVEWFVDKFTTGARFWTQQHRTQGMDPRRITLHLTKPVAGRVSNAEVDRVWEITPGPLMQSITFVLECKWGLVRRRQVDDFFSVLRWSKEFGADTPEGRQVKNGVNGIFAGNSFDPNETVRLKDDKVISLPEYAARFNIQLLKASDFNQRLRDRGWPSKLTVQEICKVARDENQTKRALEEIWAKPSTSMDAVMKLREANADHYQFERLLEAG